MRIENETLFLKKTLVIKEGDEVIDCDILYSSSVDPAIYIPANLNYYKVQGNRIKVVGETEPFPNCLVYSEKGLLRLTADGKEVDYKTTAR